MGNWVFLEGSHYLSHHGIKEQKWGVRRGPPYPLHRMSNGQLDVKAQVAAKRRSVSEYGGFSGRSRFDEKTGYKLKRNNNTSYAQDMKAVNPRRRGDKYRDRNCPYCTLAYDLRRRGYDVHAPDKPEVRESSLKKFYKGFGHSWFLTDEQALAEFSGKSAYPTPQRSKDIVKWADKELKSQGVGARGYFDVMFGDNYGHSMAYEVTKSGVKILDTQNNEEYTLKEVSKVITDVGYCRVDDKEPNWSYLKKKGAIENA